MAKFIHHFKKSILVKKSKMARGSILGITLLSLLSACDPIPGKVLTPTQKEADMLWLYSQFDENYAPLEYKMATYGFDYNRLKQDFMTSALSTPTNEDFYLVMNNFVAQFKDAHTSASLSHGGLPNRASLAYIGISGKRKGNVFVVTELLPTINTQESKFPIQVGDEISHVDGKPLADIIREQLVPLQDIGQEEANLTMHMNRIFNRVSTSHIFPANSDAVITIANRAYTDEERSEIQEKENRIVPATEKKNIRKDVTVPWNVKDIFEFRKEQTIAKTGEKIPEKAFSPLDIFQVPGENGKGSGFIGLRGFDGNAILPSSYLAKLLPGSKGYRFLNTFYVPDQVESWTSQIKLDEKGVPLKPDASATAQLKSVRSVPEGARFITEPDATFPTYITEEQVYDTKGKKLGKTKLVATLFLNTFSPEASEEDVIKEFKHTLENLQFYRVEDLVIDMINNGGGSLSLGMQLAQALSSRKVQMPEMQFILSETWLTEFQRLSVSAPSDAEQTLAGRVVTQFEKDMAQGKRLSTPMSTETLVPFALVPNDRLRTPLNVVLLVNEMCASMCDIFSAILQDNNLAKVLGSQTMGAGGNVVTHYQAPNSHLVIRQTESLMIRSGGKRTGRSYIENNGVKPDYPFSVTEYSDQKYKAVRQAAVGRLTQVKAVIEKRAFNRSIGPQVNPGNSSKEAFKRRKY